MTIEHTRQLVELHGTTMQAMQSELGVRLAYPAWHVLAWLNYDRTEQRDWLRKNIGQWSYPN